VRKIEYDAAPMDAAPTIAAVARPELRCAHCGRIVHETVHTRSSYVVDYYELHTGPVEEGTFRHGEDGPVQVYQRLLAPELVISCRDCYRQPAVQNEREQRFRPEALDAIEEASA
jgi:hypothetical protein